MQKRHQRSNVPTELLRSLIVILETGSFSDAARALDLTPAAISSQMKRLQSIVGGPVFERTSGGVSLTEFGQHVRRLALRMLDANDRILGLAGADSGSEPIRIGVSVTYAESFMALDRAAELLAGNVVTFDTGDELTRGLLDGYIDVACLMTPSPELFHCEHAWTEQLVWLKSRDCAVRPDETLPLVGSPEIAMDRIAMASLERTGQRFRLVVATESYQARLLAISGGFGLGAYVDRLAPKHVEVARLKSLPPLPKISAGIYTSDLANPESVAPFVRLLRNINPASNAPATRM